MVSRIQAGNIYVNRDQIGAVVGSQPFGGEGLSGTGPKAGGPHYVPRFAAPVAARTEAKRADAPVDLRALNKEIAASTPPDPRPVQDMPGPTGESNRLHAMARPPVLCLGPGNATAQAQANAVRALGGQAVAVPNRLDAAELADLQGIGGVIWWGDEDTARHYAKALAKRDGPLLGLITAQPDAAHVLHERHVCIDTTAAGGNAALLAEVGQAQG